MTPDVYEPLAAAAVGLAAAGIWVVGYSLRLDAMGIPSSGSTAESEESRPESLLGASWLLPVIAWVALAVALNRALRAEHLPARLGVSFLAAVIVSAPFGIATAIELSGNGGWGGLGAALFIFQLSVPAVAPVLHVVALPFVSLGSRLVRASA